MSTFFCPYTGEEVATEGGSLEHIIPESLGGTRNLAITVAREANNALGSEVDDEVAALYCYRRMKFDLRGHSGRAPIWTTPVSVGGLPGQNASWEVTQTKAELHLRPLVKKEPLPDGKISVTVSGEPSEAIAIFEKMRRAYEAKGMTIDLEPDLSPQKLEQPMITGTVRVDLVALGRFPVKVALGVGHLLWGESWSRGAPAASLRQALWSTTLEDLNAAGKNWVAAATPADLGLRVEEGEHGLFVSRLPDRGGALAVFPFGQRGWIVKLGPIASEDPLLLILDVKTRTVRRLSSIDLVKEKRFS